MTNPNDGTPVEIAMPQVLESTGDQVEANAESCTEYGQRLWHQLQRVATYLREDIAHAETSGAPGLLATDDARARWADLYGSTLVLLAGPRGDSGYGEQQARLELQNLESAESPLHSAAAPTLSNN